MIKILNWDQYFMSVAKITALRSKDPNTQVGACIVKNKRIVGCGYNGFPRDCEAIEFPWAREGEYFETKYPYVVHAELNAIFNSTVNLEGCTLYVTLFPCHECCKAIIQAGLKEIVYCDDKYLDEPGDVAGKKMLAAAKVRYRKIPDFEVEVKL